MNDDARRDSDGQPETGASQPRKALVFDDNASIGTIMVARLNKLGFQSKSVVEKPAFLASLESWRPDLILLDLSLGDTNATELFGVLSEQKFSGRVILMSGHAGEALDEARRLGERSGITIAGTLQKPFHNRDIQALVASLDASAIP